MVWVCSQESVFNYYYNSNFKSYAHTAAGTDVYRCVLKESTCKSSEYNNIIYTTHSYNIYLLFYHYPTPMQKYINVTGKMKIVKRFTYLADHCYLFYLN